MSSSQKSKASGISRGEFAPCPSSPNCVSTMETTEGHAIEPIRYDGSREGALSVILKYLNVPNVEKISIVTSSDEYIHAVFVTPTMKFRDDVEFYLPDGKGIVHFRSVSRVGHSDLGQNRKRMEAFRRAFQGEMAK